MKLDRNTYEAWLLDRIEGTLTPEQDRELDAFLAMNPDLSASTEELPSIDKEAIHFNRKADLLKGFPPAGEVDMVRLNDFLAARLEGDLTAEQEKALDRFLFDHPEAQRDARLMVASRITDEPVAFTDKRILLRSFPPQGIPDKHRLTDLLIAAQEGDLDEKQRAALSAYVRTNVEAQHEERLVAATYVAREPVVFSGKEQLKKRNVRVVAMWQRYAAAASIALLIGLAWLFMHGANDNSQRIAGTEKSPNHPPEQNVPHVATNIDDSASGVQQALPIPSMRTTNNTDAGTPSRDSSLDKHPRTSPVPVRVAPPAQEPRLAQVDVLPNDHSNGTIHEGDRQDTTSTHKDVSPSIQPDPLPSVAQQDVLPKNDAAVNGPEDEGGVTLAAFAADAVRKDVLDAPQRGTGLDGNDALAIVDKGLHAITRGAGGIEVHSTAARQHFGFRLGGFSISASRGR